MQQPTKIIKIGRDPANDIVLDHSRISRFHCVVRHYPGGRVTLTDTGSSNGTYVDGRILIPQAEQELPTGAEVNLARVEALPWGRIAPYGSQTVRKPAGSPAKAMGGYENEAAKNQRQHYPQPSPVIQQQHSPAPNNYGPPGKLRNANTALALGIISLFFAGFIFGLFAIIVANGAIDTYKQNPMAYRHSSYSAAATGKALGIIGLVGWAIFMFAYLSAQ